ncbi:hypothetical protein Ae201684P_016795 [Aphanomyces euteiches]|nr:hypothetical protein Ae201684P_016795 [Aphanomyces euteiches]
MSDGSGSEEFVLPPGFEIVHGGSVTKGSLNDKELWLFRLPKDVSIEWLYQAVQVEVERFPFIQPSREPCAGQGEKPDLCKPFTRSFSLIETITVPPTPTPPAAQAKRSNELDDGAETTPKKKKKSKKHRS